ncbi:hypothetical protein BU23DRAFT_574366 [Bimuria novae-zelandiae CBS 107.79]|uniref:DUF6604 domain-containing protein n=1 Tax=Bimuria novae-zelandiae CBS 107.79 TaxID=1447943 RepID=A0A6A5UM48_9PLEO|nr:hypothetical protein BU23DRAFT_574366 [Bimuria novae-zelandiae CBS 107.79]
MDAFHGFDLRTTHTQHTEDTKFISKWLLEKQPQIAAKRRRSARKTTPRKRQGKEYTIKLKEFVSRDEESNKRHEYPPEILKMSCEILRPFEEVKTKKANGSQKESMLTVEQNAVPVANRYEVLPLHEPSETYGKHLKKARVKEPKEPKVVIEFDDSDAEEEFFLAIKFFLMDMQKRTSATKSMLLLQRATEKYPRRFPLEKYPTGTLPAVFYYELNVDGLPRTCVPPPWGHSTMDAFIQPSPLKPAIGIRNHDGGFYLVYYVLKYFSNVRTRTGKTGGSKQGRQTDEGPLDFSSADMPACTPDVLRMLVGIQAMATLAPQESANSSKMRLLEAHNECSKTALYRFGSCSVHNFGWMSKPSWGP